MQVREERKADWLCVAVNGRLDAATCPLFETHMSGWLARGEQKLVLDCTELHYLSSAGIRVLLIAAKKLASRGGRICVAGMKGHVRDVLEMGGFDLLVPHYENIDAAMLT